MMRTCKAFTSGSAFALNSALLFSRSIEDESRDSAICLCTTSEFAMPFSDVTTEKTLGLNVEIGVLQKVLAAY